MNRCSNPRLLRAAQQYIRNLHQMRIPYARPMGMNQRNFTLEPLGNRELIRIHGAEVVPFLQGLATNDVARIQSPGGPASLYAHFLNKSGRVLYDTIMYRTNNPETILVECDREASSDFRRHLRTYRVRRRIEVDSVDDEYTTWVMFQDSAVAVPNPHPDLFVTPDPRLPALGTRILAPTDMDWTKLTKSFAEFGIATAASADNNYQLLRYKQGVGEGSSELAPGKCFPLEANADYLHGVSFQKGCYVGQELTARIHHSGVIRKRFMPIRLTAPIDAGSSQDVTSVAGAKLGRVLGSAYNHGVALLRIEKVLNGRPELMIDGERCYVDRPQWWPEDLPGKRRQAFAE
ncbi:putative transferase CAF17 homolog, mitochondrial [Drosophila takahashii]|uniref:putative transferase CAF17 homolog, mitochondrial n=1 Tax=Drosophila takahashii TaxID=29030 RepID=UPI001CF87057|nr:putative transferase CAF17 homolog, mitochondrial [Drosophila takahashii]